MKKIFSYVLALTMVLMLLPANTVFAATSGNYTYTVTGGNATITKYTATTTGAVDIPSTIDGYTVVGIGNAFMDCTKLTAVTIPSTVTSVGTYPFYGCSSLKSITVNANNTAFKSVNGVLFSKDGTTLISYPLGSSNTAYSIPSGVTSIYEMAFREVKNLTSLSIPASVTYIPDTAIMRCPVLAKITVSADNSAYVSVDGVLYNKNKTQLYVYPALKEGSTYTIPSTVSKMNQYAFYYTSKLKKVSIPKGITEVKKNTFYHSAIADIALPEGVVIIEQYAFVGCNNLTTIAVPSTLRRVDKYAFTDAAITKVYYGGTEEQWGEMNLGSEGNDPFLTAVRVANFPPEALYFTFSNGTVSAYTGVDEIVEIPTTIRGTTVTSIAENTFKENTVVKKIVIPETVRTISDTFSYRSSNLESVEVNENNTAFVDDNGILYSADHSRLLLYPAKKTDTEFVIPKEVNTIDSYAFAYAKNLKYVDIPDGITELKKYTFFQSGINEIILPEGTTTIGAYAFVSATNLSVITIPSTLTKIENYAFYSNPLEAVYYCGTEEEWNNINIGEGNETLDNAAITYNYGKPDTVPVTGVSINPEKMIMKPGIDMTATATVYPENATNQNVIWSTSGSDIAKVDEYGNVSAGSAGTAIITVTTVDGGFTAKCEVTVVIPVESIELDTYSADIAVGEGLQINATVYPEDATNQNIIWTSSDKDVATVDETGYVTAYMSGSTTITATTEEGTVSAECVIYVYDPEPVITGIELSESEIHLDMGVEGYKLEAYYIPSYTSAAVTWTVENENVVKIDDAGVITTIGGGDTVITAMTAEGFTASCNVYVYVPEPIIEGIELSTYDITMSVGQQYMLEAYYIPSYAPAAVTWTIDGEGVIKIDDVGMIEALAEGNATITAMTAEGFMATCNVNVYSPEPDIIPVQSVSLDRTEITLTAASGDTTQLMATIYPENATNLNVKWDTSDVDVAKVDEYGNVEAMSAGKATITVTTEDGGFTEECIVTVEEATIPVTGVSINPQKVTVNPGDEMQLVATVYPENATNQNVIWSSSARNIAKVDEYGNLSVGSIGEAIITVRTEDGGFTAECIVTVTEPAVHVTHVTLDQTALGLYTGESITLNATVYPEDAANKGVTWHTRDKDVAIVDEYGTVTAVGEGETVIQVVTNDGGYFAECVVEVKDFVKVESVTINMEAATITVGDTISLGAIVYPENATNTSVTWRSLNGDIATISEIGVVEGISAGDATIVVRTVDGGYEASIVVTVVDPVVPTPDMTGLKLSAEKLDFTLGENGITQYQLYVTVEPEDAAEQELFWSSSNEEVATVDQTGLVTFKGIAGTTVITVQTADGVFKAECVITIGEDEAEVTGVTLDMESVELAVGNSIVLNATVEPEDATDKSVTWTTSNKRIATVDEYGKVTARTAGTATITVTTTDGGYTAQCEITVIKTVSVTGVSLNITSTEMWVGDEFTLVATVEPEDATNTSVIWNSLNEDVAKVDGNGTVTALSAGTAEITVTTADGVYTASCIITVNEKEEPNPDTAVTGVVISTTEAGLYVGDKLALTATVVPEDATNKNVIWTSSDKNVATVDENGIVMGIKAGTVTITVTTEDGGYTAQCMVKVMETTVIEPIEHATVSLTNAKVRAGNTFEIDVVLEGNTGFANLGVEVGYDDSIMSLINVVDSPEVGATFTPAQYLDRNPFNMDWTANSNVDYNGTLATLTFAVDENTPAGVYAITMSYYKGRDGDYIDGEDVNYDETGRAIYFTYEDGEINVIRYTPGDINDDGFVDDNDGIAMLRYLAGWELEDIDANIAEAALDVDGNGKINNHDGTLLLRYLAGWDVEIN